jgi:hypothetical protein
LCWTAKSTRIPAAELTARHHPVSHEKVAQFLRQLNYSLQRNRKTKAGDDHPDRDPQFQLINDQIRRALAARRPVISVDTKEGTGWQLPECGSAVTRGQVASVGPGPRLSQSDRAASVPVRHLRSRAKYGIHQRRDGPSYERVRRRLDLGVVAHGGAALTNRRPVTS